jgi:hypothetical protein
LLSLGKEDLPVTTSIGRESVDPFPECQGFELSSLHGNWEVLDSEELHEIFRAHHVERTELLGSAVTGTFTSFSDVPVSPRKPRKTSASALVFCVERACVKLASSQERSSKKHE